MAVAKAPFSSGTPLPLPFLGSLSVSTLITSGLFRKAPRLYWVRWPPLPDSLHFGLRICSTQHKHCPKQLPSPSLDSVIEGTGPCPLSLKGQGLPVATHLEDTLCPHEAGTWQGGKWREEVGLLGLLQWAWVGPTEPAEDLLRVKKVGTWELTALGSLQVRAPSFLWCLQGRIGSSSHQSGPRIELSEGQCPASSGFFFVCLFVLLLCFSVF